MFLGSALLPTVLVGAFSYVVDPHQYYRPSTFYYTNMRYLAPGLAKHIDYEVVVVGDSLSQNFIRSDIDRVFGQPGVNLSLSGSTLFEQRVVLENAIRTGKVRRVIWGVQPRVAGGLPDQTRDDEAFPAFMYDDNPFNDWPYLFNLDLIKLSLEKLRTGESKTPPDLDTLNAWFMNPRHRPDSDKVLKKFRLPAGSTDFVPDHLRLDRLTANFEHNIMPMLQAHPEVEFIIFIPPHSVLSHVLDQRARPALFATLMAFQRHMFHRLTEAPNVRLFYFDAEPRVTHNLSNYKDLKHFGLHINRWILRAFSADAYRVTPDNRDKLLERFEAQVRAVDLDALTATPAAPARKGG